MDWAGLILDRLGFVIIFLESRRMLVYRFEVPFEAIKAKAGVCGGEKEQVHAKRRPKERFYCYAGADNHNFALIDEYEPTDYLNDKLGGATKGFATP